MREYPCPYCRETCDGEDSRHDHLGEVHDAFTLAAEGRVDELVTMRLEATHV